MNSFVIGSRREIKDIERPLALNTSFAISGKDISMVDQTKLLFLLLLFNYLQ